VAAPDNRLQGDGLMRAPEAGRLMPTITESGLPGAKPANRVAVAIIALFALLIAVSLGTLIGLLIARAGLSSDPKFGVILSLIASFIVFFGTIGVLAVSVLLKPRAELMPISGWRLLSGSLAFLGMASAIAYHWVALLPWLAMALICLLKDPGAQAWIRRLGI
jgi:hypothetical protein